VTNRPDIVPIAKAIEFAQAHDYAAVLAYCGSPHLARRMVRDVPPSVYAGGELKITRVGPAKERVEMQDGESYRFDVEKRGDRWLVVRYGVQETGL